MCSSLTDREIAGFQRLERMEANALEATRRASRLRDAADQYWTDILSGYDGDRDMRRVRWNMYSGDELTDSQ